jgi:hypothetical protein
MDVEASRAIRQAEVGASQTIWELEGLRILVTEMVKAEVRTCPLRLR